MNVPVSNIDSFIVVSKMTLNDQNHRILTLFYQPIIGSVAISLYLTLWRYSDSLVSTTLIHTDLINMMQLKLEDIIEAREKLEALGLLKTYLKKEDTNKYIYELYNPLNECDFINNPILNTALTNHVSKREYKRIINTLIRPKINYNEYNDISVSFSKIYAFKGSLEGETPNIKSLSHLGLSFEPTISFNEVLSMIPSGLLNTKSITKNLKDSIYKYSFVYNLGNEEIKEIIINSVDDYKINLEIFKENCRNYYKFENKGKKPKLVFNNQPDNLRKLENTDTKKGKLISQFESVSPYEFLSYKQGTNTPIKKDLELIEYLIVDLELLPGVVNVLIDYVLKINNNKLTRNFVEQIASQWKRSNIKTVSDAIEIALKEHSSKKTTKAVTKEKIPKWFDTNIEDDIATEEEILELERKLAIK